jgi:hypothetical protein
MVCLGFVVVLKRICRRPWFAYHRYARISAEVVEAVGRSALCEKSSTFRFRRSRWLQQRLHRCGDSRTSSSSKKKHWWTTRLFRFILFLLLVLCCSCCCYCCGRLNHQPPPPTTTGDTSDFFLTVSRPLKVDLLMIILL